MLKAFKERIRARANLPENLEAAIEMVRERAEKLDEIARNRPNYVQTIYNMGGVIGRKNKRIAELESRVDELESKAKRHNDEIGAWKMEEYRWGEDVAAYKFKIKELESELLTTRDSLDCANNEITSLRSGALPTTKPDTKVVAWAVLPLPCATCRHRIVNSDLAMYCTKIFRNTPDDGHCHLHEVKT